MSLGGSYSSNQSGSKSWYPAAKPFINQFLPVGSTALQQSGPANNPQQQLAESVLQSNVSGADLNPAANPALAPYISSLTDLANTNLGTNLADIRSNANAGGVLMSTKEGQNEDTAAVNEQESLNNTIANLYNNQYGQAVNRQQQDIAPLIANADPEYQRALQLMQTFGGMGYSHGSGFGIGVGGGVSGGA